MLSVSCSAYLRFLNNLYFGYIIRGMCLFCTIPGCTCCLSVSILGIFQFGWFQWCPWRIKFEKKYLSFSWDVYLHMCRYFSSYHVLCLLTTCFVPLDLFFSCGAVEFHHVWGNSAAMLSLLGLAMIQNY